ncbi:hypothetical protein Tco_1392122 [Tanacetum coccineum]
MNPTPLTIKSDSVVNWKIFQQGQRSIYQIIRANGADTVYISFGVMVKDFIREYLIELYRLVMQKYGTNRPEDAYDRVIWSDLRTMFDLPLNEVAIWSLPLQQKMVSWRERKALMVEDDIQATHKTKEQKRQEEAGLKEAIKLQAQLIRSCKANSIDKMIAKRGRRGSY